MVTCKLLKNTIGFPENLILNKYLELLEVQNDIGRRRCGRGRWSLGRGEEKWSGSPVLDHVLNHVMCERLESELELVCYCNAIFFKLSSELHNVIMGSTFSELFHFYFQRAKKRKRKQGG